MNDSSVPYFLVSYLFCLKNQIVPQVIAVLGGIQIEIRLWCSDKIRSNCFGLWVENRGWRRKEDSITAGSYIPPGGGEAKAPLMVSPPLVLTSEPELHRIVNLTEYRIYSFMKNFLIPNTEEYSFVNNYRIPNNIRSWIFTEYRMLNSIRSWKISEYQISSSIRSWKCTNNT